MENNVCFVIGPIGRRDTGAYDKAIERLDSLFRPAVEQNNLIIKRADDDNKPGLITDQIIKDLKESIIVIADLWPVYDNMPNANVMYELGIRHAFNKPVICLKKFDIDLPFDISGHRCIEWDERYSTKKEVIDKLGSSIQLLLNDSSYNGPIQSTLIIDEILQSNTLTNNLLLRIYNKIDFADWRIDKSKKADLLAELLYKMRDYHNNHDLVRSTLYLSSLILFSGHKINDNEIDILTNIYINSNIKKDHAYHWNIIDFIHTTGSVPEYVLYYLNSDNFSGSKLLAITIACFDSIIYDNYPFTKKEKVLINEINELP